MRALCVRVILGSATHYSNPGWVVLCEEWICQCVHLCTCVFMLVRGSELPTIPSDWISGCKFINSLASLFRSYDKLCNNQPIHLPRLWGKSEQVFVFYWSSPMTARELLRKFDLNSWEDINSWVHRKSGKKCWTWPSCSSHHVECTKTWMGDLSSVCGSKLKSAKPHSSCRVDPKRVQSSGNWWLSKMWYTQKSKLSPSLGCIENYKREEKINKRVFIQHSNEIAIHYLESWSSNENSRQHWRRSAGIWPILFERVCGL